MSELKGKIELDITEIGVEVVKRGKKENEGGRNSLLECKTKNGKTVAFWGTAGGESANLKNISEMGKKKPPIKIRASIHYENKPGYDYWIPESAKLDFLS